CRLECAAGMQQGFEQGGLAGAGMAREGHVADLCCRVGHGADPPLRGSRPLAGVCGRSARRDRARRPGSAAGSACGRHGSPREEERSLASVRSRGGHGGAPPYRVVAARARCVAACGDGPHAEVTSPCLGCLDFPTPRSEAMGISRKASAHWQGDLKTGKGTLTTPASGLLDGTRYGFNSRFGDEKGTNPEELIAAAHAG